MVSKNNPNFLRPVFPPKKLNYYVAATTVRERRNGRGCLKGSRHRARGFGSRAGRDPEEKGWPLGCSGGGGASARPDRARGPSPGAGACRIGTLSGRIRSF